MSTHPGSRSVRQIRQWLHRKVIKENNPKTAAIASETAAKLYGLEILEEGINDNKTNTTRFIIVSRKKCYRRDASKISIMFEIPHESGSLYTILSHIDL